MAAPNHSVTAISCSKAWLCRLGSVVMGMAALLPSSLMAQDAAAPITLPQAVSMALEKNPLHKAALAGTHISLAQVRQARAPLMPKIMFIESAVRGNDPVFVFGTQLRQQSFTAADFALNKLNTPTPIGNFSSRFSGQWSLFDGLQSWYGVTRAKYMQQAAQEQLDRTDQELVYEAVQAYDGVLLARKTSCGIATDLEDGGGDRSAKPGARRERHGSGLRFAQRAGSHGVAEAGTDPGAELVGFGTLAVGTGDGNDVGHDLPAAGKSG